MLALQQVKKLLIIQHTALLSVLEEFNEQKESQIHTDTHKDDEANAANLDVCIKITHTQANIHS